MLAVASPVEARLRDGALNSVALLERAASFYRDYWELDLSVWIDALRALPSASEVTEEEVLAWVDGPLRRFFPFATFWIAYGSISGGRGHIHSYLASGHELEFLGTRQQSFDLKSRGCLSWLVANRKPVFLDRRGAQNEAGTPIFATELELEEIDRYSFGAMASHCVMDPFVNAGTYVSFTGMPGKRPGEVLAALNLISPVLHTLYLQTKQTRLPTVDLSSLTDRQRDLVDLALKGLSDKAIASRLTISEHTVGNHFRAIYAKLGISKRSQLATVLK